MENEKLGGVGLSAAKAPDAARDSVLKTLVPAGTIACLCDDDYTIALMNDELCDALGYRDFDDFQRENGSSILNILHSEDLARFACYLSDVQTQDGERREVFRVRRRDRSFAWFQMVGKKTGVDEKNTRLVFLCNDYTEEMQIRAELEKLRADRQREKKQTDALLEQMPGGLRRCRLTPRPSTEYVSDGLCRLVGYSRGEIDTLFQGEYARLICAEDRPAYSAAFARLAEYQHTESVEYRLCRRDGSSIWVHDSLRSVLDADGEMWAYAAASDIDSLHRDLAQLEQVTTLFSCGVESYEYDSGRIALEYSNGVLQKLSGLSAREYAHRLRADPFRLVHAADVPLLRGMLKRLETGADRAECELRFCTGETYVWLHVQARVSERDKDRFRYHVLSQDVSQSRQLALREMPKLPAPRRDGLFIQTFGSFDVFFNGRPIPFRSAKAKELLAVLVDRRGSFVTRGDIIGCLWETETQNKTTMARCRKTFMRLLDELEPYGARDIVESVARLGVRRIVPERVSCDLFQYLSGEERYRGLFGGVYMQNYSWSEYTLGVLAKDEI